MKNNIAEVREMKGISQQELANALGVKREYLSRIENGHRGLSLERQKKIAKILRCGLDALFWTEEDLSSDPLFLQEMWHCRSRIMNNVSDKEK